MQIPNHIDNCYPHFSTVNFDEFCRGYATGFERGGEFYRPIAIILQASLANSDRVRIKFKRYPMNYMNTSFISYHR